MKLNKVSFHAIFPPVTNFKAGFEDATVRDRFNEGLANLCRKRRAMQSCCTTIVWW